MLEVQNWGLIEYSESLEKQLDLLGRVQSGSSHETLVFCSHPPVVTLGRGTKLEDLQGWSGPTFEVQRGGRATYHGPGQIVCYPILNLKTRGSDLHQYLRTLENVMISALNEYGVRAEGDRKDATGVWIGQKKIASIGIAVKKWISYHGLALNLHKDPLAFTGISPCGFKSSDMISLEELIGQKISHQDFQEVLTSFMRVAL